MPDSTAADASSVPPVWAVASHTTNRPDRTKTCIAIWLHIVPVGRYSAAWLPGQLGRRVLQPVDGRVVAEPVVPHLGVAPWPAAWPATAW